MGPDNRFASKGARGGGGGGVDDIEYRLIFIFNLLKPLKFMG